MSIDYHILHQCGLFRGIAASEIEEMMGCLSGREMFYQKGEFICREGDVFAEAGIILKGRVHILQEDFWGNRNIVSSMKEGELFGEVYACLTNEKLQISAVADTDCQILFVNLHKGMHVCGNNCLFHQKLVENMVYSIAQKNLSLTSKIQHISRRTIREKTLSYLSEESRKHGSSYFSIPFNRQQMADYLAVDRSALSKELAKMQEEGLLEYDRNNFRLMQRS